MSIVTVVHRDRLYVPRHAVNMRALREHAEVEYQTKAHCHAGCQFANRPGRFCSTCPGRDARIALWSRVTTPGGVELIAIAGGSTLILDHVVVGAYRVVDRRADPPFRSQLRWTGRLRTGLVENGRGTADQRGMLAKWRAALRSGETGGVLISPPRCITGDTLLITTRGLTRIGDWAPGVEGWHDKPTRLRGERAGGGRHTLIPVVETGSAVRATRFWTNPPEHVLRVTARNGMQIKGRIDHPIMLHGGYSRLRDVRPGDVIPIHVGQNVWGHRRDVTPEVAIMLGFWVSEGSGGKKHVEITNYDDDVRARCREAFLQINPRAEVRERSRAGVDPGLGLKRGIGTCDSIVCRVVDHLVDGLWRLSTDRVIPRSILESPRPIVAAFMQALYEGDGWVSSRMAFVGYASLSHELILQMQIILANMGIMSKIRRRMSWATNGSTNQISNPYWILGIRGPGAHLFRHSIGFFSERKRVVLDHVLDEFDALYSHQPMWHDKLPAVVLREYRVLLTRLNAELNRFTAQRYDLGGFSRWPVTVASMVTDNGDMRLGNRLLTRARLASYYERLRRHPRWMDVSSALRGRVMAWHEKYLDPKCYWITVSSVARSREKHATYDVHIPGHHRFMAGGLLNHNSGKCVLPTTMIRTNQGYHHIGRLFTQRPGTGVIEQIGRFGTVSAPGGVREIRGIYAQTVEQVVMVELHGGLEIGGSLVHPIQISVDGEPQWVQLGYLTGHEHVMIGMENGDPVPHGQGLTVEQAALVGLCLRHADFARFCTGVLHLDREALSRNGDLRLLLLSVCRATVGGDFMADMGRLPVLRDWSRLLMASTSAVWRVFTRSVMDDEAELTSARLPDDDVARALHMHLVGHGVMSTITRDATRGVHVVDVVDDDAWEQYLCGESPPAGQGMAVPIREVRRVIRPHRVMDIMVPAGKAFHTNGVVSHNTVIGVAAALSERSRTFVTASKIDFLRQFGKRFGELTNLRELYRRGHRPVVLIDPQGWADGASYGVHVLKKWKPEVAGADVVMSSYQQFLNTTNGNLRRRQYLEGKFGTFIGDEIHQAASELFSRLVSRMDCRRKLGLTATIQRKDQTEECVLKTLGPVVAKGNSASDLPLIELLETGVGVGKDYKNWAAMTKFLVEMDERNRILLRQAFADLRSNRLHSILITTTRRGHVAQLVKMINAQAAWCNANRDEQWPSELAVAYQGGADTNAVLNTANSGRTRVVVAMVSMVQHGLDVMRWTHVYVGVVPTSNPYATYQLINRVCTPYTPELEARVGRKPQSVARMVIDALGASVFCFAKLFKNQEYGLKAGLTTRNYVGVPLYRMAPAVFTRAADVATYPKSYSPADVGVETTLGKTKTGKTRRKSAWKASKPVTRL